MIGRGIAHADAPDEQRAITECSDCGADHRLLDVMRRQPTTLAMVASCFADQRPRDVIAIAPPVLTATAAPRFRRTAAPLTGPALVRPARRGLSRPFGLAGGPPPETSQISHGTVELTVRH